MINSNMSISNIIIIIIIIIKSITIPVAREDDDVFETDIMQTTRASEVQEQVDLAYTMTDIR